MAYERSRNRVFIEATSGHKTSDSGEARLRPRTVKDNYLKMLAYAGLAASGAVRKRLVMSTIEQRLDTRSGRHDWRYSGATRGNLTLTTQPRWWSRFESSNEPP